MHWGGPAMAASIAPSQMNESGLRALFEALGPTGALPGILLVLPQRADGMGVRVAGHLVKIRAGGFLVVLPNVEEVDAFLRELSGEEGADGAIIHLAELELETTRGRPLGAGSCLLFDLTWEMAKWFMRVSVLRSTSTYEVIRFTHNEVACRPRRSSVEAVANAWIAETMDSDTAGEYLTAEEAEIIPDHPEEEWPGQEEM